MEQVGTYQSEKSTSAAVKFSSFAMIVIGFFSFFLPAVAGVSISIVVGGVVMLAGFAYGALAFAAFKTSTFFWRLLVGLLFALTGLYMLVHPGMALATLTLIVAVAFAVEGVVEVVSYFSVRGLPGAGYLLFNGLCSLLLAFLIWQSWPSSSAWAIGTLVGINLITTGITRFIFSARAKS